MAGALRVLADQQSTLQGYLAALVQSSTSFQTASENIFGEIAKPKSRAWSDLNNYRNSKVFRGESKDWEEFADKLSGPIMVGSPVAAESVEHVETKVPECQLEDEDFEQWIEVEGREDDRALHP